MKRRIFIWSLPVITGLFVMSGLLFWLLGTGDGARWLFNRLSQSMGSAIVTVEQVEGCLSGEITLKSLRVRHNDREISLENGMISWNPMKLIFGQIAFNAVYLKNVSWIEKKELSDPLDLTWPNVPLFLRKVWGGVDMFQMDHFSYRKPAQEPVGIDRLRARLLWRSGIMTVSGLDLVSPEGRISGMIGAGFEKPALFGNMVIVPVRKYAGYSQLHLILKPAIAAFPEQLSGEINGMAYKGQEAALGVQGLIGFKKDGIVFHHLKIHESGKSGNLMVNGEINTSRPDAKADLQIHADGFCLPIGKTESTLRGTLTLKGNLRRYEGRFDLAHRMMTPAWVGGHVSGQVAGSDRGLRIQEIQGALLGGNIAGRAEWTWGNQNYLSWSLQGRHLDPAKIYGKWTGILNVNISGALIWRDQVPLRGHFNMALLDSQLGSKSVSGLIASRWENGIFTLDRCNLQGRGFQLSAHGVLEKHLDYQVRLTDLAGLLPDGAGRGEGAGWLRRNEHGWAGALNGQGRSLSFRHIRVGDMQMKGRLDDYDKKEMLVNVRMLDAHIGPLSVDEAVLSADGKPSEHNIHVSVKGPGGDVHLQVKGGYDQNKWFGTITQGTVREMQAGALSLSEAVPLMISKRQLLISRICLTGADGESVSMEGNLQFQPRQGELKIFWQKMNLARANLLLGRNRLTGQTSGAIHLQWNEKNLIKCAASASGNFIWNKDAITFSCPQAVVRMDGNDKGVEVKWDLSLANSGRFNGTFTSIGPAVLDFPKEGHLHAVWQSIDMGLFKSLISSKLNFEGRMNGHMDGVVHAGLCKEARGGLDLQGGRISWKSTQGVVSSAIRRSVLDFVWKQELLNGKLSVDLSNYGNVTGMFQLPTQACHPLKLNENGPVRIRVQGDMSEQGMLTAIFPGVVKETQGKIRFELGADGTWGKPDFHGRANIEGAGARFPVSGIHLEDASAEATWIRDRIHIQLHGVKSGESYLRGAGTIWLKDWGITRYEGRLTGENIQTVYLPEIRLRVSPDITFSGNLKKVTARGSIHVPEAWLRYVEAGNPIRESRDVIIAEAANLNKKKSTIAVDSQILVTLGKKVHVQYEGLDVLLGGKVILTGTATDKILVDGQVEVVKGFYERYGAKLDIARGRIVFKQEPVDLGNIDILALKKVRDPQKSMDLETGVTITGNLRSPLVKLYARPAMSERDVLAYLVTGKPFRQDTGGSQQEQVAQLAAAIFAGTSSSSSIPGQLQQKLGIDSVGIESSSSGGISRSIVTVGKYLSPDLYVAFGRSLIGDDYYISTRYSFLKHWQIESRFGLQSGTDIFYRIEFE